MAADGVHCEPFSDLNSLLTGKNTGNFSIFAQQFPQRIAQTEPL
jgi:hypothetical protein